ncbi:flavin reductase [Leuconostoc suionicum]|uniref:flavin reductase n=1 Tax=Leuconostoc suionicum TaxID=1511761 RepID=UPI00233E5BE2|nr:flavin reductase [Leuconostoc suionicum]MDC2805105.1 flavin reductase [Leuconostoc suionicum]MDC2822617.1 flavin reductase [Leuconostoc suionicum]
MFKKTEKESFYYGSSVLLMTTKDPNTNEDNITVISSTWTLGKTIAVGLGLENKGFSNLTIGSEATFNIADAAIWKKIERIARTTGGNISDYKHREGYTYCSDKFKLGGFTKFSGEDVSSVRIKDCPIQIETTITEINIKEGFAIGAIKEIFVDEKYYTNDFHIDVSKWFPLIYKFREYSSTNKSLGINFRFQEFKKIWN